MEIVKEPDVILHKKLSGIKQITPEIVTLAEDMRKTMIAAEGVGLAANQVGQDLRLFVILKSLAEENQVPDVLINPEITEYSREVADLEEGCLSIPNYYTPVSRPKKIKIKALDLAGNKVRFRVRGLLARVIQHETDHLNGLLIKDRAKTKHNR